MIDLTISQNCCCFLELNHKMTQLQNPEAFLLYGLSKSSVLLHSSFSSSLPIPWINIRNTDEWYMIVLKKGMPYIIIKIATAHSILVLCLVVRVLFHL